MEFDCTKEGKNIYFACREKAAKYNDLLMQSFPVWWNTPKEK